jgi:hypothetical protein
MTATHVGTHNTGEHQYQHYQQILGGPAIEQHIRVAQSAPKKK